MDHMNLNTFLKNRRWYLLAMDVLLIPTAFFFEWLSGVMLAAEKPCRWTLVGAQCGTCGGTHFVNSLLNGRITEAFHYNEFLFFCMIFLVISYILLHLWFFFDAAFAKKMLRYMYSIPTAVIAPGLFMYFIFWRNADVLWTAAQALLARWM